MLNCVFLIPIDHRGIQGQCFGQYLELQSWCDKNNAAILTCNGLFLNFARNFLATGGGGFADTSPPKAPDYSDENSWYPVPNRSGVANRNAFEDALRDPKPVDVFFVHPTT